MKGRSLKMLFALLLALVIIWASLGFMGFFTRRPSGGAGEETPVEYYTEWEQFYAFNEEGYEPSIATDSQGNMYYTAHKNVDRAYQDRLNTWGNQLASWFFVSTDDGQSWYVPEDPYPQGAAWKFCLGDEGDIAVDANDYVYYVDTTLRDINWHVWANGGQWQYSQCAIKSTTQLDDRPWTTAQGNSIVHYLGNNAASVAGQDGRFIYYRSTDGANTFTSPGVAVPGDGWLHMDAERYGPHTYIVKETTTGPGADIVIHVSEDEGATWEWSNPVYIGHRDAEGGPPGEGSRWPVVASGENGSVFVLWGEYEDCEENGSRLWLGRSLDYGQSWNVTEITPFQGLHDYFWMTAGPNNTIGVSFYSTTDLPTDEGSEWYIYGGLFPNASDVPINEIEINITRADPNPVYAGIDYHALHDFHENVVTPDGALNIAYQYYVGPGNGDSALYYVRGWVAEKGEDEEASKSGEGHEQTDTPADSGYRKLLALDESRKAEF